jgi:hypothetical protein
MVCDNNYHLTSNEEFFISLTSKLVTYFIDSCTLGMKSQSIAYLPNGSEHIFWALEVEVY